MGLLDFFDTDECEYADLRVDLEGSRIGKLQGLKIGDKINKSYRYGEGNNPRGIQHGNREPVAEVSVSTGALHDMNNSAISLGYRNILDVRNMTLVVTYRAKGSREQMIKTLTGFEFDEFNEEWAQGDADTVVALPAKFINEVTAPVK